MRKFVYSRGSSLRGQCKPSHRSTCHVWQLPTRCCLRHHHHNLYHHRRRCRHDVVWHGTCCSFPDNRDQARHSRRTTGPDRRFSSTPKLQRLSKSSSSAAPLAGATDNSLWTSLTSSCHTVLNVQRLPLATQAVQSWWTVHTADGQLTDDCAADELVEREHDAERDTFHFVPKHYAMHCSQTYTNRRSCLNIELCSSTRTSRTENKESSLLLEWLVLCI